MQATQLPPSGHVLGNSDGPLTTRSRAITPQIIVICGAVLIMFAACASALYLTLRPNSPQQVCKTHLAIETLGNSDYVICGDTVAEFPETSRYQMKGNVVIKRGFGVSQPVVMIRNMPDYDAIVQVRTANNNGELPRGNWTADIYGAVHWFSGTSELALPMVTTINRDGITGTLLEGFIFNIRTDEMFSNPGCPLVGNSTFGCAEITPTHSLTGTTYVNNWLGVGGFSAFQAQQDGVGPVDIDLRWNLDSQLFTASRTIRLDVIGNDNSDLRIRLSAVYTRNTFARGAVNDFSARVAGWTMDARNITLTSDSFKAGAVNVLKSKNLDVPFDTDPNNPDILFAFAGLKYQNKRWSLDGVEVPIRDFGLGANHLRFTSNKIGLFHDESKGRAFSRFRSTISAGEYLTASNPITTELVFGFQVVTQVLPLALGRAALPEGCRINDPDDCAIIVDQDLLARGERALTQTVVMTKPFGEGGITAFTANMGEALKLNLNQVKLVANWSENFYGLAAEQIALQWNASLGGQSAAGMTGFKLGADRDAKFKFALNGGILSTPQLKSKIFEAQLTGTVQAVGDTAVMTFTGNVAIKTPGGATNPNGGSALNPTLQLIVRLGKNVKADCGAQQAPACIKRIDGSLSAFAIKLVGFTFSVSNPKIVGDGGGFYASAVSLKLPDSLGGLGATLNGLSIPSDGKAHISGGSFSLPPIKLGKMELSVSGGFATEAGPNNTVLNVFTGAGQLKLPSITPTGSKKINASVTIKTIAATGALDELDTMLSFDATAGNGIKIGTTGAELLRVSGQVHLRTGQVTVNFGVGVGSVLRLGPLPLVKLDADTSIQNDPFRMTLDASFKVLVFQLGSAHVEIGDGAGFFPISGCPNNTNPGCVRASGFYAGITVNALFFHGDAYVRMERRNGDLIFAGEANLDFGLRKGQFGANLPRKDRTLASIHFLAGQFDVPSQSANTFGTKANFEILGWDYSIFMDWNKVGNNGLSMGHNLDSYVFVPTLAALQRAADGEPGWTMTRVLNRTGEVMWDARSLGRSASTDALFAPDAESSLNATFGYNVPHVGNTWIGVEYTTTQLSPPTVSLVLPNGVTVTQANAGSLLSGTIEFEIDISTLPTRTSDIGFAIKKAPAGQYQLIVNNAPSDATLVAYTHNASPVISQINYSIGPRGQPLALRWAVTDTDSPTATQDVGYTRVDTSTYQPVLGFAVWLSRNLALSENFMPQLITSEIPSGVYQMLVKVDDRKNTPVFRYAPQLITITNIAPPVVPAGLIATALPNGLLTQWTPNGEGDLHGYEIGFGASNDPATFVYTRDLGWREGADAAELMTDAFGRILLRRSNQDQNLLVGMASETLGGMPDGLPVFWSVRAYDQNLNYSAWSNPQSAQPWALAPKAHTPAEGGVGNGRVIEVTFNEPLNSVTLSGMLEIRDANGVLVPGTVAAMLEVDGLSIIGLRFTPNQVLRSGAFAATLRGGANGIAAISGRTMNADYAWAFTMEAPPPSFILMLPLLQR